MFASARTSECGWDSDYVQWINSYMPWTAIRQLKAIESNMWIRVAAPHLAAESRMVLSGLVSTAGAGMIYVLGQKYPELASRLDVQNAQVLGSADLLKSALPQLLTL